MTTESTTTTGPSVYVGTYAKYNAGSIRGAWLDLEGHDADSFAEACAELHADESDPELMFQDFEGFPREFYGESGLSAKLWEWLELDDDDRELLAAYADALGYDVTIDQARNAFVGRYDSGADYAEQIAYQDDSISKDLPIWVVIDWEASWESNLRHDYATTRRNGDLWIFCNT